MEFALSEEQSLLRHNLDTYLRKQYDFEQRRAAAVSESGWRPEVWQSLAAELGLLGMGLPERAGGMDCGPVETLVVMQSLGAALVIEPYLETCVIAGGLLADAGGERADALLAGIAEGEAVVVPAWSEARGGLDFTRIATRARKAEDGWRLDGRKAMIPAAPWASHFLVSAATGDDPAEVSVFAVERDAPGVTVIGYPTIDGRRAADVVLEDVVVSEEALIGPEGGALPLLEAAGDRGVAGLCAEGAGVVRRLLDDTVEYTTQRRQFGQPISRFQALQHRMVNMYLEVEMADSAAMLAALSLDAEPAERARAVSSAKATVGRACRLIGQEAVQMHGGMGMTDEMPVSHYSKRATVIEGQLGSVDQHLRRHARLERALA